MSEPRVSVVIATYNYGRFIREALESVLGQTYDDLEIIVVDDGSTDDTAEAVRPYMDRISYVRIPHSGHVAARKVGTRRARGRYICFLDADDVYEPDKLERQVALLDAHPELDFVFSDFSTFDETGAQTRSFMAKRKRFQQLDYVREGEHRIFRGSIFGPYLRENFILPGTMLARREYVERVGLFDGRLQIRTLAGRLLHTIADARVAYTDRQLLHRRKHGANISGQRELIEATWIRIYSELLEQRGREMALEDRLVARRRIGRYRWRMGRRAAQRGDLSESRRHFRESLSAWPWQILGYVALMATYLPGGRRLLKPLLGREWV